MSSATTLGLAPHEKFFDAIMKQKTNTDDILCIVVDTGGESPHVRRCHDDDSSTPGDTDRAQWFAFAAWHAVAALDGRESILEMRSPTMRAICYTQDTPDGPVRAIVVTWRGSAVCKSIQRSVATGFRRAWGHRIKRNKHRRKAKEQ